MGKILVCEMVLYTAQCHVPRKWVFYQASQMELGENAIFGNNCIGRLLFLKLILWLSSSFFCHLVTTAVWEFPGGSNGKELDLAEGSDLPDNILWSSYIPN